MQGAILLGSRDSVLHKTLSVTIRDFNLFPATRHKGTPGSLCAATGPGVCRRRRLLGCIAQGVTQQQQPAGPKSSNEDPLDSVLARLPHLHKKKRTQQKGKAPSSPRRSPSQQNGVKNKSRKKDSSSAATSPAPAEANSVTTAEATSVAAAEIPLPEEPPVEASSSWDDNSNSSSSTTTTDEFVWYNPARFLNLRNPGPSQTSIDAAIEAVMAKIQAQEPAGLDEGSSRAAATLKPAQLTPDVKPDHSMKEEELLPSSSSSSKTPQKGRAKGSSDAQGSELQSTEINMTKKERDQLFKQVYQTLQQQGFQDENLFEDEFSSGEVQQAVARKSNSSGGSSSSSKADSSNRPAFKGFGLPPSAKAPSSANRQAARAEKQAAAAPRPPFPSYGSVPPLSVFLYCAEVAKTHDAIAQLGLQEHIKVVDDLKKAHAVLSVKIGRGGRLNNLQQGKRTASNQGIPFVCVGRRMTHETLLPAVAQLLLDHHAKHGQGAGAAGGQGNKDDLTQLLVAAATAAQKQVQLQPGWAQRMISDLGM